MAEALRMSESAAWSGAAAEAASGLYALRPLTASRCDILALELDRALARQRNAEPRGSRPNSMHEYGFALEGPEFRPLLQDLLEFVVRPLAAAYYPHIGGETLDSLYGFVAEYARGSDEELGFHVDDSEVTLNLCIDGEFDGSELYFQGARCEQHRDTPAARHEDFEYAHVPGVAILHAGKHRHGVHPLRRGRRRNLILWCRSTSYRAALPRAAHCTDWCGVVERRAEHERRRG